MQLSDGLKRWLDSSLITEIRAIASGMSHGVWKISAAHWNLSWQYFSTNAWIISSVFVMLHAKWMNQKKEHSRRGKIRDSSNWDWRLLVIHLHWHKLSWEPGVQGHLNQKLFSTVSSAIWSMKIAATQAQHGWSYQLVDRMKVGCFRLREWEWDVAYPWLSGCPFQASYNMGSRYVEVANWWVFCLIWEDLMFARQL